LIFQAFWEESDEKAEEKDSQTAPTVADKPGHAGQNLRQTV
jgi:hypothetical protein